MPAGAGRHVAWPATGEYVPGAHGPHDVDAGRSGTDPAGHCWQVVAPGTGAYRPAAQGAHDVAPVACEAVPDAHGTHDVAFALLYVPGAQAAHDDRPADDATDPGGQASQTRALDVADDVPGAQGEQARPWT